MANRTLNTSDASLVEPVVATAHCADQLIPSDWFTALITLIQGELNVLFREARIIHSILPCVLHKRVLVVDFNLLFRLLF